MKDRKISKCGYDPILSRVLNRILGNRKLGQLGQLEQLGQLGQLPTVNPQGY
ncbi:MAG: hypothetical protein ACRC2S_20290 [Waterburya sp.]